MKTLQFTKNQGLLTPVPGTKPIDFFHLLANTVFDDMIIEETDVYAEQTFFQGVKEKSRLANWKPVTLQDLQVFFGVFLHMGTWKTNRIADYWKTDPLFSLPCFAKYTSRDRFLIILRCLHFTRNPEPNEEESKDSLYYKVRP